MTFDVNKPESSDIESSSQHVYKLLLWKFYLNNFPLQRNVLRSKLASFFYHFLIVYQVSCHFAAVETDAKNVTGRIAAWNNRTSSAYCDVSDQVFSGCCVRRLLNKITSV